MKPAYLLHKEKIDFNQAELEIKEAKDEWEHVSTAVPASKKAEKVISPPVTCDEVLLYFHSKDMSYHMKHVKPVKQRRKIAAILRWLIGPPKLHPFLIPDRDLLFAIAQCPFDSTDPTHLRVLQTLYKALTGISFDCPRYGSHWERIGFQGIDPSTDLRGVGFLGLYHLLSFILNPLTTDLCKEIVALSQKENQDFPFCLIGINITRMVLEAMREEVLNKECNRRKDIFLVTNEFYAGIYLHLYITWKDEKKTIFDSGYILKDLSALTKARSSLFFGELKSYLDGKMRSHFQAKPQCTFSDIGGISFEPSADML